MKKIFDSFVFAWKGLKVTWREENNFRIEVLVGLLVIFCLFYFSFSFVESALCVMAIILVLSAEIINTAVEDLCNKIESNHDPVIEKIKDVMATFVLVSVLGAFAVGFIVFYHHFI